MPLCSCSFNDGCLSTYLKPFRALIEMDYNGLFPFDDTTYFKLFAAVLLLKTTWAYLDLYKKTWAHFCALMLLVCVCKSVRQPRGTCHNDPS